MAYGYRRSFRRGWYKRSLYGSQVSGTRRFRITIPVEGQVNIPVVNGTMYSATCSFFPYAVYTADSPVGFQNTCLGNLFNNNLFNTYCTLYDEVKINSMYLRMSILDVPIASKVCFVNTYLDRHADAYDLEHIRGHAQVDNSAEVQSNQFTSMERATIYRKYRASDLSERTGFLDSTVHDQTGGGNPPTWGRRCNREWSMNAGGVFVPQLGFYVRLASAPVDNSNILISFRVLWSLTFRNPKASVGAASRSLSISVMKNDAVKEIVDESEEKEEEEEVPVLKKKKVVYEEEVIPDDEKEEDDEDEQEPMTQPFKSPMKKAGKKSS